MEDYILISTLNDFIFCPYSIYLHNVYMNTDEEFYQATPQIRGKIAHTSIDDKTYSTQSNLIMALPIISEELGLMGKIDLYKYKEQLLIERKYQLKQIYQGQIYQLWAQYFCMLEMGYDIKRLAFYELSANKMQYINVPNEVDKQELICFIDRYRNYNPMENVLQINTNKCNHCIYCNLCDKTDKENVYS